MDYNIGDKVLLLKSKYWYSLKFDILTTIIGVNSAFLKAKRTERTGKNFYFRIGDEEKYVKKICGGNKSEKCNSCKYKLKCITGSFE
jgi:hypothetical protein